MQDTIQERVRRAYQSGFEKGKKVAQEGEKYPDGVDWHIIGTKCDCQFQNIPVADNAGEDIRLHQTMSELRDEGKCETCGKYPKIYYIDGNMASKKEGWKPKAN